MFHDAVSALVYSFAQMRAERSHENLQPPYNDLTQFVLSEHGRVAEYLRAPLVAATLGFDILGLLSHAKRFHRLTPADRARQITAWKNSRFSVKRDLVRYFESLSVLALYSRDEIETAPASSVGPPIDLSRQVISEPEREIKAEIVVIGSGPGGAITACLLAEARRNVLLLEEGEYLSLESCIPFSRAEMIQKYRNGGQTVAIGANKVAYVEGRCVGGGSEINSGLYHRTPPDILENWRRDFTVAGLSDDDLLPHFEACERELSVSPLPGPAPAASLKLHEGATRLRWHSMEVPRWFKYAPGEGNVSGKRQSMTETYIPRFLKSGGRLLPRTRAESMRQENNKWTINVQHTPKGALRVFADTLFICAGAVQTPALLRRSGIHHNVGNSLRLHPTVKVVAKFNEPVNSENMGVPVHQVKEFAPRFSFGCSVSTPPHLALGLLDHPSQVREISSNWRQMAVYYAMITGGGRGTVRPTRRGRDPVVKFHLTPWDRRDLGEGLYALCEALFASGARALYPTVSGSHPLHHLDDLKKMPGSLPSGRGNLMTIHLFSSCPMGEDASKCAADSFGRVHGFTNLFIADASLLCTPPGVNPQGTIMALARRNALKYLATH